LIVNQLRGAVFQKVELAIVNLPALCLNFSDKCDFLDEPCSTNGEKKNAYRLLVGKPEGKRPLGRPRRRWVDNMDRDEMRGPCSTNGEKRNAYRLLVGKPEGKRPRPLAS
jgi:hypothetical protein